MLVINRAATIEPSERRAAEWMAGWTGQYAMRGISASSYWLDGTKPGEPSRECDFVLTTPQRTAAVENKGTHPEITFGTITAHENGPWRHDVLPVDPVRTRE
ncbi:hypothetical protein ACWEKT_07365 [Nocardia takedensis]